MAEVLQTLNVWRNPVFQRFRRSRLRMKRAIFWYLITLIVASFSTSIDYIVSTNMGTPPMQAARSMWIELIVIQGLILMLKGTGSVSAGLIQDKIDQTIDYQRLTPMSPIRNLIGYLFGLPVLEYVMFALTLPNLIFIIVVGDIPIGTVFSVYFSFFTCVILYHMTGIAAGMVMQKWFLGYLLSILMVFLINVVLPAFISQVGLKFLQYLSVWPVIGQKVLPLVISADALRSVALQNPYFSMSDAVPFFNYTLSAFTFTVVLQGALIGTFVTMALRRWKSSNRHSLSKPFALAFLGGFIVLFMGNLWPAITGQYLPFPLFGVTEISQVTEVIAISLPQIYCITSWVLCLFLFTNIIPAHHSYVRGIRRAFKLGQPSPGIWDDDSGNFLGVGTLIVLSLAGFGLLFSQMSAAGYFDIFVQGAFSLWRLPVSFCLVLIYSALLIQVLEHKPTVLVVLLLWCLPILVAIVLGASMQTVNSLHAVIASLSPVALMLLSTAVALEGVVPVSELNEIDAAYAGVNSGLIFISAQIVFLAWRWRGISRLFYAASAPQESA